jgi:hypothetical protein
MQTRKQAGKPVGKQSKKTQTKKAVGYGVKRQGELFYVMTPSGRQIVIGHETRREAQQIADIFNFTKRDENTVNAVDVPKQVNVFLEGGIIHNIELPEGVRVTIYDYDTEGSEPERIRKDGKGDACIITTWDGSNG